MIRATRLNPLITRIDAENIAGKYESETLALFDRMAVRPDSAHRDAVNGLVRSLKTAGIWAKLDGLYVLASHTQQAALLNWVGDFHNLIAYNSPVFTADQGIAGDGASAYLQTPSFSGAGKKMAREDEAIGYWVRRGTTNGGIGLVMGTNNAGTGSNRYITPSNTGLKVSWKMNTTAARSGGAQMSSINNLFISITKDAVSSYEYSNGALDDQLVGAPVDDPRALTTLFFTINRSSTQYSANQISAAFHGRCLSASENAVFYNHLADYMTTVGAL